MAPFKANRPSRSMASPLFAGCGLRDNGQRRAQVAVAFLGEGNDDVQAIGGAALEDYYERLAFLAHGCGGAGEPGGDGSGAGHHDRRAVG
ncbi:MAG: hypothetical protein ABI995_10730 [Acidobacteriota bacterium]